ncbi:hypothetical protein [Anaerophaga thermohalophila]|jgi:hypothetical protein|uniref:hypothetical protein n=1 Tax=Anaerophaga thermohalophila TaxID=177400 RepID=UPI0002D5DB83|nr:hypothetical protein [Anaerophaga thermohalophila]
MKTTLLFTLLALFSTISLAQNSYQDVIYLKDGSIIRGIIVEQVPNRTLKIETADKNVFVYEMDEVERIRKEAIQESNKRESSGLKNGYRGIAEVGYGFAVGDYGLDRIMVNFVNGYQLNPHFFFGVGTGLRYYSEADNAMVVPFFADFRTYFMDRNFSPNIGIGIGYSFEASEGFEGLGLLFNPSVGVDFEVGNDLFMNVGMAYEMQRIEFEYYGRSTFENSGAISLNVGVLF